MKRKILSAILLFAVSAPLMGGVLQTVELIDSEATVTVVNSLEYDPSSSKVSADFESGNITVTLENGSLSTLTGLRLPDIKDSDDFQVQVQFITSYTIPDEGPHIDLLEWKHGESKWVTAKRVSNNEFKFERPSVPDPTFTEQELETEIKRVARDKWLKKRGGFALSKIRLKILSRAKKEWKQELMAEINFPMGC